MYDWKLLWWDDLIKKALEDCTLGLCLCSQKIFLSVDFYFHKRKESCIPPPSHWKLKSSPSYKISSHFFLLCKENVVPNNERIGCTKFQNNFSLYHIFLFFHKCNVEYNKAYFFFSSYFFFLRKNSLRWFQIHDIKLIYLLMVIMTTMTMMNVILGHVC